MESNPEKRSHLTVQKFSDQPGCLYRWRNQEFSHQKRLGTFLDHPFVHLIITILVVVECATVIIEILLHTITNQQKCNAFMDLPTNYSPRDIHKLDLGMEICHFLSLTILSIFLFEILLKIYAYGSEFWTCQANHVLDYFDAVLVILSFSIEIYFLIEDKESILAHSALLLVVLRLWHIARIANAAVRCFQKGEELKAHHREHRTQKFSESLLIPTSIQAILHLMQEKTECLRSDKTTDQILIERWDEIDQRCQDVLEDNYGDETKLVDELQKLHRIMKQLQKKKDYPITV